MRCVIHDRFGNPAEVLRLGEQAMPEPGRGQVRVRTLLSPIHNHDLWTIAGRYGYRPTLPAIGGSEAVGVIDAVGPDVTGVAPGQRVAVASVHETWAEYFLAPAQGVVTVPDAIADESAAQLIAMPFSAIALLDFLAVQAGDWIIQNAANGAVGKTLTVLAESRGVHVVNLVRRDAGVDELAAFGIGNAVSTAREGWADAVRAITGDAPIRAGVDSLGGGASGAMMALLGEGGTLVSFGTATGEPMAISSGDLIFKQAVVKGFWGAKVGPAMAPDKRAALFGELITLAANGGLPLSVEGVFGLDAIGHALAAATRPGRSGKVLFRP